MAQGRTASALSFIFCKVFRELALLPQEPSGRTEYHKPTFPVSQLKNRAGRGEAMHPPGQFTSFYCAPAGCQPLPGAGDAERTRQTWSLPRERTFYGGGTVGVLGASDWQVGAPPLGVGRAHWPVRPAGGRALRRLLHPVPPARRRLQHAAGLLPVPAEPRLPREPARAGPQPAGVHRGGRRWRAAPRGSGRSWGSLGPEEASLSARGPLSGRVCASPVAEPGGRR